MRSGHYRKKATEKLPGWKKELVEIARDLYYPQEFIARLMNAETESEGIRIMHDAREAY